MTRGFIKLKLAQEFCRWAGPSSTFRSLVPDSEFQKNERYHNLYSAYDIRRVRLALMDIYEEPRRQKVLPPIIYSRISKGGTGKTCVTANLAACMALQGYRVLMIDADPQASLTTMFGIDWATEEVTHIGDLLKANEAKTDKLTVSQLEKAIRPIYADNMLDLIASDITLTNIESWLTSLVRRELTVAKLLNSHIDVFSRYDVIVIDGAPGSSQLSVSLTYATQAMLAVVMLDGQSLKAMEVLAANLEEMNEAFPDRTFNVRIVANGYVPSITNCQKALDTLKSAYPGKLDTVVIPRLASFLRQVSLTDDSDSGPVIEREPTSPAAQVMIDLSRSLLGAYDVQLAGMIPMVIPRKPGGTAAVRAARKIASQRVAAQGMAR